LIRLTRQDFQIINMYFRAGREAVWSFTNRVVFVANFFDEIQRRLAEAK